MELSKLKEPFKANELEWRLQQCGESNGRIWGKCLCYISNRSIQARLDKCVGEQNWRNEYKEGPSGGILCGISIKVGDEWITKWDGADNTQVESVKGGLSDAMKRAGAKEVHLLISSPPVKFPCYFGIDTAYRSELMAANHNIAEMTDILGADSLGYLSMEGMYKCFGDKKGFCIGCLSGVYPVATPIEAGKEILER